MVMGSRALLLLLVSCASAPLAFSVDPAFTGDEQTEIRRAADTWNAITQEPITFNGDEWRIEKRAPPPAGTYFPNGYCDGEKRLVLIHPLVTNPKIYEVVLHEFGHVLGLRHTSQGVMQAVATRTEFSAEDLEECRRVEACR